MNLLSIVSKVGTSVLKSVIPGASAVIDVVNTFLPNDKKLDVDKVTGSDIESVIASLPADQQASILSKQFDVEIVQIQEENSTLRTMLESDAANPHSTRPLVIKIVTWTLAFITVLATFVWAYGVLVGDVAMIETIMNGWVFLGTLIAPFVTVLHAYFGVLRKENKQKIEAASGQPVGSLAGLMSAFIKK